MNRQFDIERIRKEFPMLSKKMNGKPLVYLDSAASSLPCCAAIDRLLSYYREEYGTVHRAVYELVTHSTEQYQKVRSTVAHFVHAREEEIIFTKGTTEGINLVASSFGKRFLSAGDEVLIPIATHHANLIPWQFLSQERGVLLKEIPVNGEGEILLDQLEALFSSHTKLVALPHVDNVTGVVHPIHTIAKMAHDRGAKVLVDGAQAAAHLPIDVEQLGADFYLFSGHKIYGPTGVGVLYGKREWLEEMAPYQGGGDMVDTVSFQRTTFQPIPLKFEAGTPPIGSILGLGSAIEYLEQIGKENIAVWEEGLRKEATRRLLEFEGVTLIGNAKEKGSIITFTIEGIHPLDLGTLLGLKGVAIRTGSLCAQTTLQRFEVDAVARISFGIYSTYEEIEQCFSALEEIIPLLRRE